MHAINKIDIGMTGRSKEHLVALSLSGSRVRREIALAQIDLNLNNPAGESVLRTIGHCTDENFAQQLSCYDSGVPRIKPLRQDALAASRHLRLRLPATMAAVFGSQLSNQPLASMTIFRRRDERQNCFDSCNCICARDIGERGHTACRNQRDGAYRSDTVLENCEVGQDDSMFCSSRRCCARTEISQGR